MLFPPNTTQRIHEINNQWLQDCHAPHTRPAPMALSHNTYPANVHWKRHARNPRPVNSKWTALSNLAREREQDFSGM
jgi:hypothetical protein